MKRNNCAKCAIAALAVGITLMLSGCLQSETVVRVRPDGSGEVVERFTMAAGVVEMLAGFAAMGGEESFSLLDEAELRGRAGRMGPGVRFLGAEPVETGWGEGYVARYAFTDINTLRVNQNPSENVPMEGEEAEEYLTFSFRRGNPSVLEVRLPGGDESAADGDEAPSPDEIAAASQFYQDMRIAVRIEVIGSIVSTNADHRSGNTVTLMDIDFNRILQSPELSAAVLGNQAGSLAEVQRLVQGAEGIAVETKEAITISLR